MKYQITSTLASISEQVFQSKNVIGAKKVIVDHLNSTNVKDKLKMIDDVNKLQSLNKVWSYYSNALLKFEGYGVNQMQKTARQAAVEDSKE